MRLDACAVRSLTLEWPWSDWTNTGTASCLRIRQRRTSLSLPAVAMRFAVAEASTDWIGSLACQEICGRRTSRCERGALAVAAMLIYI